MVLVFSGMIGVGSTGLFLWFTVRSSSYKIVAEIHAREDFLSGLIWYLFLYCILGKPWIYIQDGEAD